MKASRQRLFILTLLFIVTAINYMDRANLAVAGSNIQNDFSLTPTQLGLLFSMFTWAYAASQIPVGYVLDRIGSRILYGGAIILWSYFYLYDGVRLTPFIRDGNRFICNASGLPRINWCCRSAILPV